jgi:hypothetical protein
MSEENSPARIPLIILAAVVIPIAVVAAYVLINREPVPYAGQVVSLNVYPIHRDLSQSTTTEGVGGQNDVFDEILLLADVRITNTAKIPLYVHDMWAVVDLPDEAEHSTAVSGSDFDKVFIAYPDLKQYQKPPLERDTTIQPGQQVEGMMIFSYQISKAKWDSRSGTDLSISFLHQNPLVMHVANQPTTAGNQ